MRKKAYIVDYNSSNVKSVNKAFVKLGYQIEDDIDAIKDTETLLIIPGVGHFGTAMKNLITKDILKGIKMHHRNGGRILGICLGMQLMFCSSDEAPGISGIGLIKGKVNNLKHINKKNINNYTKMHLGWSNTEFLSQKYSHDMYYVHQYFCEPEDSSIVTHTFSWGDETLCSGLQNNRIIGFQFHPEKSGKAGLDLLDSI